MIRAAVVVLIGLVPVLGACGDDDDDDAAITTADGSSPVASAVTTEGGSDATAESPDTTEGDSSETTAGTPESTEGESDSTSEPASGEPIELMLIDALTGVNQYPERVAAATAAVEAINAAGGVQGRPLELASCDTKQQPADEAVCAQQLVDSDAVAAVSGGSGRSTAVVDATVAATIANIGITGVGATDLLQESTSSFPLSVPLSSVLACPAALAEVGATNIGAVTVNYAAADQIVAGAQAVMANIESQPTFTSHVKVDPASSDMAAPLQSAIDAGANGVILAVDRPKAIAALKANGSRVPMCTSDGVVTAQDLIDLGDDATGFSIMSSTPTVDLLPDIDGDGQQYLTDLDAYYESSGDAAAAPEQRKGSSLQSWMAVYAFARVAEQIEGEITRESVFEAFTNTTELDFPGLTPYPIDFTNFKPVPALARLFLSEYTPYFWDVADGGYVAGTAPVDLVEALTGG